MGDKTNQKTQETKNDQEKGMLDQHGEILTLMLDELKALSKRITDMEAKQAVPQTQVPMQPMQMPGMIQMPQGYFPPYVAVQQLRQSSRTRHPGNPQIDMRTCKVYKSKAAAAKDVFHEYAGRILPNGQVFKWHGWAIHDILLLDPGRFIDYRGVMEPGTIDANYVAAHKTPQTTPTETDKK